MCNCTYFYVLYHIREQRPLPYGTARLPYARPCSKKDPSGAYNKPLLRKILSCILGFRGNRSNFVGISGAILWKGK